MRYTYASGYKTRDAADEAIEDMIAAGEVSLSEMPEVRAYTAWVTPQGGALKLVRRFAVVLQDD